MIDQELEYGDLGTDIYDMLANIENDFKSGSNNKLRIDSFKIGFESIFNMPIDEIDDVEERIANQSADDLATKIELYEYISDSIVHYLDTYYGITFNIAENETIDLNKLYMVYRVIFLNLVEMMANCLVGRVVNRMMSADTIIDEQFLKEFLQDDNEFIVDNIQTYLDIADQGNVEYRYVFGTADDALDIPEVSVDIFALRPRLCKEYFNAAGLSSVVGDTVSLANKLLEIRRSQNAE
jgi:hypothetical protein